VTREGVPDALPIDQREVNDVILFNEKHNGTYSDYIQFQKKDGDIINWYYDDDKREEIKDYLELKEQWENEDGEIKITSRSFKVRKGKKWNLII
jgi:hypothetical protein